MTNYPPPPYQEPYQDNRGYGGVPPLDQPYYGAPPVEAVKRFFKKYVTFSGRASRSEYWWWVLASAVVSLVLFGIWYAITGDSGTSTRASATSFGVDNNNPLSIIWTLATFIPSLAVTWRRLHDTGRSGGWYFLILIPFIGWIPVLIWLCSAPRTDGTRFDRR